MIDCISVENMRQSDAYTIGYKVDADRHVVIDEERPPWSARRSRCTLPELR